MAGESAARRSVALMAAVMTCLRLFVSVRFVVGAMNLHRVYGVRIAAKELDGECLLLVTFRAGRRRCLYLLDGCTRLW